MGTAKANAPIATWLASSKLKFMLIYLSVRSVPKFYNSDH
jgi:hypothetical protein